MQLESRFIHKQIINTLKLIDLNNCIIEQLDCSQFIEASFKLCLNGSARIRFLKNNIYEDNIYIENFLMNFICYPIIININNYYLICKIYNYKIIGSYVHFYISIANSEELNNLNINLNESNIIDINNIYILSDSMQEQHKLIIDWEFAGNTSYNNSELLSEIWEKGSSYMISCVCKSKSDSIIVKDDENNISPTINIKNGNNYLLKDNIRICTSNDENIRITYIQNNINPKDNIILKIINGGTISCKEFICIFSIINKYKIDTIINFLKK